MRYADWLTERSAGDDAVSRQENSGCASATASGSLLLAQRKSVGRNRCDPEPEAACAKATASHKTAAPEKHPRARTGPCFRNIALKVISPVIQHPGASTQSSNPHRIW